LSLATYLDFPFEALPKVCFFASVLFSAWCMDGTVLGQNPEIDSLPELNVTDPLRNNNSQPYNLQLGPVTLRAEAGSSVSYNDNINLARTGRQNDCIITPNLNIHGLWQATELNALTFDLGISYQHYFSHSIYDAFQLSPDSQTQFNIFIDDFKINLHEKFSYQSDPLQVAQLSNVAQFDRFLNDAGITIDWDLGDITISLGYDHDNFWVFEPAYSYLTYQSDVVSPQISFALSKTIQTGLQASFADTKYNQNIQNNYTEFQVGPFLTAQLSENLSVNARVGWDYANFAQGGLNGDKQDIDSFYCSTAINHRVNDVLTESLTAGREFIPGITSNYTQRIYAKYMPSWHATSLFDIGPQFWWENLDDSNATFREVSNRFGAGLDISFALTEHSTVNLNYQYVIKNSDQSALDYYQNSITAGFNYHF
jgi:opacity protein-like surface antigen